ncbi:MAG: antibiotic biosynthesis monooxygenase [Acidihalobacter sp.]|uniref:antibiotic biosynthesis monooxygenase family protein n=1 Tax=Acidihalobacter sp. TaxID=1872108 RepID=UPI00307F2E11
MTWPASTPPAPYYVVIFTSLRSEIDDGYARTAQRMEELAAGRRGFLGIESVREGAQGITLSYWSDLEAIREWKADLEHVEAQRLGRERWYERYSVRVARVERAYDFG